MPLDNVSRVGPAEDIVPAVGPDLPADPALPVGDLLGDGGRRLIERHLAGAGLALLDARPVAVFYRPEHSVVARFTAGVRPSRADRHWAGTPEALATLTLGVACDRGRAPEVWTFPDDPDLPGLPAAHRYASGPRPPGPISCSDSRPDPAPPAGTQRLPALGELSPAPVARSEERCPRAPEIAAVELVRYRPRRRAVLRYRLPREQVLYAKVLTPVRARRTLAAAERIRPGTGGGDLRLALPGPGPAPGALLVPGLDGRPLRDLLLDGGPLPHPDRLARLSDDLAALCPAAPDLPLPASPARVSLTSAAEAARLAGHLLPGLRRPAGGILEAVASGVEAGPDPEECRPVHGDLYEAQVLVGPEGSLGLVDLDDLGLGDPLLDAATFSAHLAALALGAPAGAAGRIRAYRIGLRRAFLDRLGADEQALRWREAYALLLLAPGPFRALRPDWPLAVTARLHAAAALLRERRPQPAGRRR